MRRRSAVDGIEEEWRRRGVHMRRSAVDGMEEERCTWGGGSLAECATNSRWLTCCPRLPRSAALSAAVGTAQTAHLVLGADILLHLLNSQLLMPYEAATNTCSDSASDDCRKAPKNPLNVGDCSMSLCRYPPIICASSTSALPCPKICWGSNAAHSRLSLSAFACSRKCTLCMESKRTRKIGVN